MAQQLFPERRTRSQLTLPDDLLFHLPQCSPLKNARLAESERHSAEESRQKRSAEDSPTRHSEPPPERQVKRAKTAPGPAFRKRAGPSGRRTHARIASDPNASRGRPSTRKRSTPPVEPAPVADARGSVQSEPRPVNTRAQSAPLFPTSYSSPFIDLKNPPPSPRRAHSRSPEREKLEIIFEPVTVERNGEKMDVEEDMGSAIQEAPQSEGRTSTAPQTIETHATIITDSFNSSSALSEKHKASTPSTPAPPRPDRLVALSPLTPLFETPQSLKSKNTGVPRQELAPQLNVSHEYVKPQLAGTSQMGSASGQLENRFLSLAQSHSEDTSLMGPPARSGTRHNRLVVAGRKFSKSSDSDAFSVMMRASQEKTDSSIRSILDKGKQRAGVKSLAEDLLRSGATMKSESKVKSRMRPREKPKVEPLLKLSVPSETDPETDEPLGRDHEPTMEPELSDSVLSIEQPPPPISKPTSVIVAPQQREPESETMDNAERDIHPMISTAQTVLPPDLPEEPTHGPSQEESSVDPTSQDVGEKPLTENAQDVEHQEEARLPPEPADMNCDQPAGSTSDQERQPSQIPEAIVDPASKASNRRGPRSNQKKAPTLIPVRRMTRSTASKMETTEPTVTRSALQSNIAVTPRVTRLRSASIASPSGKSVTGAQRKGGSSKAASMADTTSSSGSADSSLPVKSSNYARPTTSSTAKVTKSPMKPSRPSAFRASRPSSTPGSRASSPGPLSRLFPAKVSSDPSAPSSLSTLSTALEKLRMPPPSRPSTSTGFYTTSDDSGITHDEGRAGLGKGLPLANVKSRRRSNSFTLPSTYGAVTAKSQSSVQQHISAFFPPKQNSTSRGSGGSSRPSNKLPPKQGIFGGGVFGTRMRSRAPKVSRKTSLPMVVGSPVKGGKPIDNNASKDDIDDDNDASLEIVMDTAPDTSSLGEDEYFVPIAGDSPKETGNKEQDDDGLQDKSSRRASLASLGLSSSLSALPPNGSMGPPPVPKHRRITRSVSSGNASTSQAKLEVDEDDRSKSNARARGSSSTIDSPLKFLKDCVVFVDVRTEDGDFAGSLFVEMLESAGAKLSTRVGQRCTHIIFKNGLLSTMSRYRLLRDPKPHVVGVAWIVECVEQRKHVDESKFLIDLSEINVAGVNKRRKSLLPKLVADELDGIISQESDHGTEDGDRSMDGSNSSLILDDLPPLERARRRKSFLFGPRP